MSTLTLNPIPAGALTLVQQYLQSLPQHQYGALDLATADIDAVKIFAYLPVVVPAINRASETVQVDACHQQGSVAVLQQGEQFVGAAFMHDSSGTAPGSVSRMSFGGIVDYLIEALRVAENAKPAGQYAPCLVLVAPLGLNLLQLMAGPSNGADQRDFYVPVAAKSDSLAGKSYDAAKMNAALSKRLKALIASMPASPSDPKAFSD